MTTAYIYKWTHLPTSKWYIGVRTKQGCHPNDGYICSSKIVKPLIETSPAEWRREILHTGTLEEMIKMETTILTELDAKNNKNSYNLQNGDGKFTTAGMIMPKEWKNKISKGNTGKVRSEEARENYRRANSKKAQDPEYLKKLCKPKPEGHGAKVSAALKGISKTEEHKQAMSLARIGKKTGPCSDERRKAISISQKGKPCNNPTVVCPHCNMSGPSGAMNRWHFNNCKHKK